MKAKHKNDGNHSKRGLVSGNGRYNRVRLAKWMDGKRVGDLYPRKNVTMGKN